MEPTTNGTHPDAFPQDVDVAVLQDDIDQGVRKDASACPIARACQRVPAFQGAKVAVTFTHVRVTPEGAQTIRYDLGHTGEDFVSAFDWRRDVQPVVVKLSRQEEREVNPDIEAEAHAYDQARG